jgi:hypothetical protein
VSAEFDTYEPHVVLTYRLASLRSYLLDTVVPQLPEAHRDKLRETVDRRVAQIEHEISRWLGEDAGHPPP